MTAQAASPLSSSHVEVDGESLLAAPAAAVFLVAGPLGLQIEAEGHAVIERTWWVKTGVLGPTGSNYAYEYNDDPGSDRIDLGDVRLASTGGEEASGVLVRPLGTLAPRIEGQLTGLVAAVPVKNPRADQYNGPLVKAGQHENGEIHEEIPGEFVRLSPERLDVTLTGDLMVEFFGPKYTAIGPQGTFEGRTGADEEQRTGPVIRERAERHTILLRDAQLRLQAQSGTLRVFSPAPLLDVDGTVRAVEATGARTLGGVDARVEGSDLVWEGESRILLSPSSGRLLVDSPEPVETAGSVVAPIADLPPSVLVVGLAALVAAVVAAVVALRRRARGDPLEAAVLAMEEERWEDALKHLAPVLKKTPDDPLVLVDQGLCFEQTGRLGDARAAYERAVEHSPFHAEAHYYYARTLAKLRLGPGAIAHLARALSLDPRLTELARREAGFRAFADHPQFRSLVG